MHKSGEHEVKALFYMDRIFYRSGHSGSYGNGKLFAEYRCIENGVVQFMDAAHAVLQQLFYAPLIAVYCAYTWRVENFNHNRNALMTAPVPTGYIFCKAAEHLLGYAADTNMGVGFVCSVRKNRRAARAAGQCYFLLADPGCLGRNGSGDAAAVGIHGGPKLCGAGGVRAGGRHHGAAGIQ